MFYNNDWKSCYDELISWYPTFYRDVREMKAILQAHGSLADKMQANIEQVVNNAFVTTADESTIAMWEKALGIEYETVLTLEQRKSVVISHICGHGHIGEPEIREVIAQYSKDPVTVAFDDGVITVTISGEIFDTNNLYKTLISRIPAHLALILNIIYGYATATSYYATAPVSISIVDGATAYLY